jgi:predicted aldo/keto reductase-like oxidoreductase
MKALARGKLAEQAEEALRYVLENPYVHAVSVGIKNLKELEKAVKIESGVRRMQP